MGEMGLGEVQFFPTFHEHMCSLLFSPGRHALGGRGLHLRNAHTGKGRVDHTLHVTVWYGGLLGICRQMGMMGPAPHTARGDPAFSGAVSRASKPAPETSLNTKDSRTVAPSAPG